MNRTFRLIAISLLAITLASCASHQPAASPTTPPFGPAAVGDGGRIAVAVKADGINGSNSRLPDGADIFAMDPDGSNVQQLTDDPAFDACPDIGSSGKLIAFC